MKKEIDKQKRDMHEKIEKLKQGKMDPNELLKSISLEKTGNIKVNYGNKPENKPDSKPKETIKSPKYEMPKINEKENRPKKEKLVTKEKTQR